MPESTADPSLPENVPGNLPGNRPGDLPEVAELATATTRYLQALTELDDESLRGPSVLPEWDRAHVVAHVARNADAFARVVRGASAGERATMYDGQDARNADIEDTVRRLDREGLVSDAHGSAGRLADALRDCVADPRSPYTRTPGDRDEQPLATVGPRRRLEVEVHHADLAVGYRPADWPTDFSVGLVGRRHAELGALGAGCPSMVLVATDVDGLWTLGAGKGPEIRGAVGDLGWWLVGRGDGHGLSCATTLPRLDRWR